MSILCKWNQLQNDTFKIPLKLEMRAPDLQDSTCLINKAFLFQMMGLNSYGGEGCLRLFQNAFMTAFI